MTPKPKLLHRLKNHEIYPYFRRCRSSSTSTGTTFRFLDLAVLKKSIQDDSRFLEFELEQLLYGTEADRVYSGWTLARINRVLQQSGFGSARIVDQQGLDMTLVAQPGKWPESDGRWEARLWAFRKKLRATAVTYKNRARSLVGPIDLRTSDLCLNLGAGGENYPGFVKVDLAGAQDVYDNIVTLSKFSLGTVAKIYTNHVLEHIPSALIAPMLRRWREVLKPGGVVLARIPDAHASVACLREPWVETTEAELEKLMIPNFLERETLRAGTLDDNACIQMIYGWSDSTPHSWDDVNQHKTLWTPRLARSRFEAAGYEVVEARNLGTLNTLVIARKAR